MERVLLSPLEKALGTSIFSFVPFLWLLSSMEQWLRARTLGPDCLGLNSGATNDEQYGRCGLGTYPIGWVRELPIMRKWRYQANGYTKCSEQRLPHCFYSLSAC